MSGGQMRIVIPGQQGTVRMNFHWMQCDARGSDSTSLFDKLFDESRSVQQTWLQGVGIDLLWHLPAGQSLRSFDLSFCTVH
jgi:hypothetical protein